MPAFIHHFARLSAAPLHHVTCGEPANPAAVLIQGYPQTR